jgi:pimeloyl-ACP methyl ester carboxylesterase/DNA-binding SARP family transcriptional activator
MDARAKMVGMPAGAEERVGLLGPLRLRVAGRELGAQDLGGRKPKQVLEVLLVHDGAPVAKDRIADLIWGEALPADWPRTLEAYVSVLRKRLCSDRSLARRLVVTEPGAYRFEAQSADIDVRRFDDLVARAAAQQRGDRREMLESALSLVRGPLLADEPYADWLEPTRRLYAERVVTVQLDCAEERLVGGEPRGALELARRVLAGEPTRERAHRLVMLSYYASGELVAAQRAFEECHTEVGQSLGVDPLPETTAVRDGIVAREPLLSLLPAAVDATQTEGPRGRTEYARSGATAIAFQVVGSGPRDVVFIPGFVSHVEVCWELPAYARFLHRLAAHGRLVLFDKRGTGMSDPVDHQCSLEERIDDIRVVMDAAGSRAAVLFGISEGGPMSALFAQRYPERVEAIVMFGTASRFFATADRPGAWTPDFYDTYVASIDGAWADGHGQEFVNPSTADDERLREWTARYFRLAASPRMARQLLAMNASVDVTDLLPSLDVPTLVVHRRDERWVRPDNARFLADHIPGARLALVDGADHWPWVGEAEPVLDAVDEFIAGLDR